MAPTETQPHPLHLMLPQLGAAEDFAAFRRLLADCNYTDAGISGRLGIASVIDFQAKCEGRSMAVEIEQPIDVLIRLLLDGEFLRRDVIEGLLPAGSIAVMERLGVLAPDERRPDEFFAPIVLYPAGSLLLAGDRPGTPDGSPYQPALDIVYPGIVENTRNFLASLPQTPCDALLDVGTGSGVAALLASRYARRAWGADIASRSARFAEFNRRLNGIGNVEILEGNLYEPVTGLTFDRIVTHPPYVPAPKNAVIFRDGGDDGEQILRRVIEGLPVYLRPGGRFYTLVLGADLEDETFEARIRKWLGPADDEFDLVMVSYSLRPPAEFLANSVQKGKFDARHVKFLAETWARRRAQFLFYGTILIRRHSAGRPAITARVQKGEGFVPAHQEWLLDWETRCKGPGAAGFLLDCRPSISPVAELHVLHRVRDGRFSPELYGIESKSPFLSDVRCTGWMVAVISECDGRRSWRELFNWAKETELIDRETPEQEYADVLALLAGQGILRIPEHLLAA